jgi:hypothetical protein
MNLLIAARCSTGWMVGMVGTCTKFRYQSRPIHSTPLMTCSQRMTKVAQAWSTLVHWPVRRPDDDQNDDEQDDACAYRPAG